uniref:Uncharacterized protein n=1 Tax=Arundo donax TaxID=35708 RepID=A0A0A8ZJZ7_ARUDO
MLGPLRNYTTSAMVFYFGFNSFLHIQCSY